MRLTLLALLACTISLAHAEPRTWTSSDGSRTFVGSYVSHDEKQVTIRREDGQTFDVTFDKLSLDDKSWLAQKDQPAGGETELPPNPNAVFDTLCFGDSRADVIKKLNSSKVVEGGVDQTFLGRTGLNGTYRTREKVGGLECELYFNWSEGDNLTEVTVQSRPVERSKYDRDIRKSWEEFSELLSVLHGVPVQAAEYPNPDDLKDDMFLGSHLWRLKAGGSALLGTSMQAGKCMVVVRFTTERINPVKIAAP